MRRITAILALRDDGIAQVHLLCHVHGGRARSTRICTATTAATIFAFRGYPSTSKRRSTRRPGDRHYTVPEWVDFDGAECAVIDGDAQVARGVCILSTPGHSPGQKSVVFDTADGAVLLAGQAIYSRTEYEQPQTTRAVSENDPPPDSEQ